jgi:uncharacterized protein YkwD
VSTLKRLAAGMIAGVALVSLIPATTAGANSYGCHRMNDTEREFVRKMNRARGSVGDFRGDWDLNQVALKHTREMVARSKLYHTPENAFRYRVTNWSMLGENVGVGGSVDSLHRAFMNSSGHRANITSGSFRRVGVGALRHNGRLWVTVVFQARSNPGTPLC